MNCLYCQKDLIDETIIIKGIVIPNAYKTQCDDCKVSYRFTKDKSPWKIILGPIDIKDDQYFVIMFPNRSSNGKNPLCKVDKFIRILDQFNIQNVMSFKFIPKSWTPANITEKIKIYLPFI